MRPSTLFLLLLIALFATTLSQSKRVESPSKPPVVRRWIQIKNLTDPEVVEIAKFAVSEHNKEANTKLELGTVVRGEKQVVNGFNYRLLIQTKNISPNGSWRVEVWSSQKTKKLLSFSHIAN